MIVHAQVFEIKHKSSLAEYTLSYQTNNDLDYGFIKDRCQKFFASMEMENYDDRRHMFEVKEQPSLLIYFRYVKKNLFLVTAIDREPGLYDDQLTEMFDKFHGKV